MTSVIELSPNSVNFTYEEPEPQWAVIVWDDPDPKAVRWEHCCRLLEECADKSADNAHTLTSEIDTNGKAPIGIYDFTEAELIKDKITSYRRCKSGGKLRATLEKQ